MHRQLPRLERALLDAFALQSENCWGSLLDQLRQPVATGEWHCDPQLVQRELDALAERCVSRDEATIARNAQNHAVARGALEFSNGDAIPVVLFYPDDYPSSPPTVRIMRDGQHEDIAVDVSWTPAEDCGVVLDALRAHLESIDDDD